MYFKCEESLINKIESIRILAYSADDVLKVKTQNSLILGNTMARAGLVLLCGSFEAYIRDLAREYIDIIEDESIPLKYLSDHLFSHHVESINEKIKKCIKLDPVNDTGKYRYYDANKNTGEIDKSKLCKTEGNPSVEVIDGIFFNLGIPDVIEKLTKKDFPNITSTYQSESKIDLMLKKQLQGAVLDCNDTYDRIETVINKKWPGQRKRRSVGYVSGIQEILKRRNRIAHGEGDEPLTPADLLEDCLTIEKLSKGLLCLITQEIERIMADYYFDQYIESN